MSEAQIEAEVHKADPAVRLGTFVALPLAAAAVAWAWHLFRGYLDALVVNSTGQLVESAGRVADLLVWVLLGGAFLLALLAAFWGRLARRIVAAGRYPFAGARLFHDMRILRGDAAAGYAHRTARNAWLALALLSIIVFNAYC